MAPPSSAFSEGERALLESLERHGVPYLVVGLTAAVLQGANTSTRDIDLWFADTSDPRIGTAVRAANGVWVSGTFGMRPPQIGGDAIGDRLDVVIRLDGLETFANEYARSLPMEVDGLTVRVLPLARILVSKRAAGRPKDLAAIPALEEALAVLQA